MIDPATVCLFFPPGLRKFKFLLFSRIGEKIKAAGGRVLHDDFAAVAALPDEVVPIIGGSPELKDTFNGWRARGRKFITWDRGYMRRVFATWLPRGDNGGYYRWTIDGWQMKAILPVPDDRWRALNIEVKPWRTEGRHIVLACPSPTYEKVHGIAGWTDETIRALSLVTDRQLVVRDKETKRPLQADLDGAHCLITHGSIAAIESVILGCPVIVHPDSAAALVGRTKLKFIERLVCPDRTAWLNSLAYSQYSEPELVDGTLWRLIA